MRARRAFWKWSAIGLVIASCLIWSQATAVGGLAGMLQVGETSSLRPLIENELGNVPVADGLGHDGQIFYAIGLDLDGSDVGPLLDHAAYRYRRILYPLVASLFGLLDGQALLLGMVGVAALSMASAAGLVAAICARAGRTEWLTLAVVLNPGIWLSIRLLTSDALALALMLAGLYAFSHRPTGSASAFALSGLAKDVILATPVPLSLRFRDWNPVLLPVGAMAAWIAVLTVRFGGGASPRGNIGLPFLGLIDASSSWTALEGTEWFYLAFALLSVLVGAVFSIRRSWLRWPVAVWTALAIVSSNWVWDFGNNAARAFAPLVVLAALTSVYADTATDVVPADSRTDL